ncbi:MAG: DedA family protein [Peptococcia bacterium]
MQNWIIDFMAEYGYLSVFLLIMIENIFPPIPSELILTFGGFMTTYTRMSVPGFILFATVGSMAGAAILYGIGYLIDPEALNRFVGRWGHILRLKLEDVQRASDWFHKYGYWTVFFCRMVPILRSVISIPAGMARMNKFYFFIFTLIGTLIWNTVLVCCGAWLGESWGLVMQFMANYSRLLYVLLAVLAIVFIISWYKRKKR